MSETSSKPSELAERLTRITEADRETDTSTKARKPPLPEPSADTRETDDSELIDEDPTDDDEGSDEEAEDERDEDQTVRRTRRGKKKGHAVANANKKSEPREKIPTHEEIPRDEILQIAAHYSEIRLDIKRQAPNGTWSNIRQAIICPPAALFDLQGAVEALAGGGTFVYIVADPNTKQQLVPRWKEHYDISPKQPAKGWTLAWDPERQVLAPGPYEGSITLPDAAPTVMAGAASYGGGFPGHPFQAALTAPPGAGLPPLPRGAQAGAPAVYQAMLEGPQPTYDALGRMLPPPENLIPPWLRGWQPEVQWNHVFEERKAKVLSGQGSLDNPWVHHEIRQSGDLKAQLAAQQAANNALRRELDEKLAQINERAQQEIERAREEKVRMEKELERARHEAELKELRALIETRRSGFNMAEMASALAPFAPAIVAWMTSGNETRKAERESEVKLLTTMLTADKGKKDTGLAETLTALAPLVVPVVVKMLETRGPQATAEVLQIEHEQRMMLTKMIVDMVQQMAPEPEPAWKQLVDALIQGIGGTLAQRQLVASTSPRAIGSGSPQQTQQPAQDPTVAVLQRMREEDPDAANDVQMVFSRLPQDMGFHTHEWLVLLFNLHARNDPEELVPHLFDHLQHCQAYNLLPTPLAEVFTKPTETLQTVFGVLPIAQKDRAYVEQVIQMLAQMIEDNPLDEDEDEPEVAQATVIKGSVVTPPPTKPQAPTTLVNSTVIESS